MDKIMTVAIIGCGGRGARTYGRIMNEYSEKFKITSICDIQQRVIDRHGEEFGVPVDDRFTDEKAFFEKKRADLLVIGTQDQDHTRMTLKGLELGYDILVEKPLTSSKKECRQLIEAQKKSGRQVLVGHVLRYAPAFCKVEELLHSGVIGKVVAIDALEQVWYGHQAHSFVRGNWRRKDETSAMILAKCCHDFDLLQYYAGAKCKSISSVGDLTWFKPENAPDGAAERCVDCKYMNTCPYSAKRIYVDRWIMHNKNYDFTNVVVFQRPITEESIYEALRTGPYGRCVYHCDNDVVDHELTTMTFENGVKATLTMTAFTGNGGRVMRIHGSLGEILLDEDEDYVKLKVFGEETKEWKVSELIAENTSGHGGGDRMLVLNLYDSVMSGTEGKSSLEESIESHLMGIAAEKSRLAGGKLVFVHR